MTEKQNLQNFYDHEWLRREAGEGWHKNGLNEDILGAAVLREWLLEQYLKTRDDNHEKMYDEQVRFVGQLKEEASMGMPPKKNRPTGAPD